jgi:hypothetical protein
MMRRLFGSELENIGLLESAAPVAGSTRIIDPLRPVGSPLVRTSCERSEPPSAVGTV